MSLLVAIKKARQYVYCEFALKFESITKIEKQLTIE